MSEPEEPLVAESRRSLVVNELEHSVVEWSSAHEGEQEKRPLCLLLHGYMDVAASFRPVAKILASDGYQVVAPDLRGFGRSARLRGGGYYHFADYVFDVAELVDILCPSDSIALVGHSMGGTAAVLYAGTFPERVRHLALLEGTGPLDNPPDVAPTRMRRWIEDVRKVRRQTEAPKAAGSWDEAFRRLAANHPAVERDVLARVLGELVCRRDDGELDWLTDPMHKTTSPLPFFAPVFRAFAAKVTCPVLYVSGGSRGYHPPDEAERLAAFATLQERELPGAGHMMHWTEPEPTAEILLDFFRPKGAPSASG